MRSLAHRSDRREGIPRLSLAHEADAVDWDLARGFHVGPEHCSSTEAEDTTAVRSSMLVIPAPSEPGTNNDRRGSICLAD